ncbi:MAG: PepSY domain-containing protein [Duganella sp.]
MKKALLFLHKWLGVALALLFLIWFISGIVLYFVPFPSLTPAERLAGLPTLALAPGDRCCLSAQQAQNTLQEDVPVSEARLGMHAGQPVWRLLAGATQRRWIAVDARSGAQLAPLSPAQAAAVAAAFSGRRALHTETLERDQWTVAQGFNPYRPLVRVTLDGDDGLELYVATGSAEVVGETRRTERAWNWIGAVPHWIYFTELRRWPERWHNVVVWLSVPGVLLAASGLILGIWQLFLNRSRWIPYRVFWMRWHHILGLAAGLVTLTWIFSGLMSMNPWSVFSPRGATPEEQQRWRGDPAHQATLNPAQALQLATTLAAPLAVRELETLQWNGQHWYRLRAPEGQRLIRADGTDGAHHTVLTALPDTAINSALRGLRQTAPASLTRIDEYDTLYYASEHNPARRQSRPLPVWRASWADGVVVYADPASTRIVLRADASTHWQRLLYNGLHSFDFAPLIARPWLRNSLIVLLSLLGIAMSITACILAWRIVAPAKKHSPRC